MLYLTCIYLIQDRTEKKYLSIQTMTLNLKNFQATAFALCIRTQTTWSVNMSPSLALHLS
jgi:hypothetical protein